MAELSKVNRDEMYVGLAMPMLAVSCADVSSVVAEASEIK